MSEKPGPYRPDPLSEDDILLIKRDTDYSYWTEKESYSELCGCA